MINDKHKKIYENKLISGELLEARKYKDNFLLKKKIYKFVSLNKIPKCDIPMDDINKCIYIESNKNKITSILNKKIRLSLYKDFNDPFELSNIYINENKITKEHYSKEILNTAFDCLKNNLYISCFTDDFEHNLPMWAHYTNNHKGFCLEFEIEDPKYLYPVMYKKIKKLCCNTTIHNYIALNHKSMCGTITPDEEKQLIDIANIFLLIFSTKQKIWEYESEYRLFYPNINNRQGGYLVDMSELGLKLTGIYLGNKVEDFYKDELKDISVNIGVDLYEMYIEEANEEIKLEYKKIL